MTDRNYVATFVRPSDMKPPLPILEKLYTIIRSRKKYVNMSATVTLQPTAIKCLFSDIVWVRLLTAYHNF